MGGPTKAPRKAGHLMVAVDREVLALLEEECQRGPYSSCEELAAEIVSRYAKRREKARQREEEKSHSPAPLDAYMPNGSDPFASYPESERAGAISFSQIEKRHKKPSRALKSYLVDPAGVGEK